jgi:hypothetical protein
LSESSDEQAEKSTVLMHVARALFPTVHLPPWMSIHPKHQAAVVAAMRTVADIAEELDRRRWLSDHPGEPLPPSEGGEALGADEMAAEMKKLGLSDELVAKVMELVPPAPEEEEEAVFQLERVRGGSGMLGFCVRATANNLHDVAPSINGTGRLQGLHLGMAQKTGVAVEPKKRSLMERVTFRGKDKERAGV